MSIRKYIPDTITSMNLLCGVVGVILSLEGRLEAAFIMMLAAAACDFMDGLAARLLHATSGIGKELDSLADVVSFGVLPAIMLCMIGGSHCTFLKYFPMILAAFSAFRLAKFNLDERQHDSFIGLPTPASAMVCGSLACFVEASHPGFLASWCSGPVFLPLLALALSILLVSEIPMFSMKFGGGGEASRTDSLKRNVFLCTAVLSVLVVAVLRLHWSLILLVSFLGYILVNLFFALCRKA